MHPTECNMLSRGLPPRKKKRSSEELMASYPQLGKPEFRVGFRVPWECFIFAEQHQEEAFLGCQGDLGSRLIMGISKVTTPSIPLVTPIVVPYMIP